jgi:hypothetical protein
MNIALTRSQQRLEELINAGRPLTEPEQDELYRALHADYMRKWRGAKAAEIRRVAGRFVADEARKHKLELMRAELVA